MDDETLVHAFVTGSQDGLWVLDLEGRTRYANPALARMYSGDPAGPAPESAFDVLDDLGQEQLRGILDDTRAGRYQGDHSQETLFHDRDGHQFWVLISDSLLLDHDGAVTGLVVRVTDFADTHRTRAELSRSRADLEEARAVGKLGSWRLDVGTGVVSVPGEPDEGDEVHEVATTTLEEFLAGVHPHDREHAAAVIRDALAQGDGFDVDVRVPRPEGWAWIRGRGIVHRDDDGVATSVSGTYQDVSEIKDAERALQIETQRTELVGRAATAANESATFDEALRAVHALAREHMLAEHVSGWTATGGRLVLAAGDHDAEHERLARRAHESREVAWHDSGTMLAVPATRRGTSYGVLVFESGEPLDFGATDASAATIGAQLGLVGARERTLRELVDARDAATAAARQKSEFLATVSHELRTPLNGIIGLTDLLLRTALDAEQLRFSSGVQVASRALLRVINDVLDFSTLQAGAIELEHVEFEPRDVLDRVGEMVAPQAAAAGVELVVSSHPDVPSRLTGDPARFSQVLVNLVANAVKFAPGGEVFVHATWDDEGCADHAGDGVCLAVAVRDTGVGIEPGRVGEMFDPFTQADTSHSRQHGGAGLGLAIARELAHALGGDLQHSPTPGGGSTFTLHASFPTPPTTAGALDEYARTWLAGRRVLVVDERAHQRTRLAEATTWWRMRIDTVATTDEGRAVLDRAARDGDPVEALVVDLDRDDHGALALATEAGAAVGPGPVVLALTTDASPDMAAVRAAGVSVCLSRPVTDAVLRGTLLEQLAGVPAQPLDPEPAPPATQRRRILVVEDNPVNQMVATGLLQSLGYDADVADDGRAALELLAHTRFDGVLMDVQMPGLDGYATTRALRQRGFRLPVIALTAAAVEGERQRCLDAGMDDFLTKPVDPHTLDETLRQWLGTDLDDDLDGPEPLLPPTPPIDGLDTERLDMLRDLDPGDTTYLDRAIDNFERNSVEAMATMRDHAARGDAAALKAAAHKIAGSALNLGVERAGALARELELAAESGSLAAALPLLDRVEASFDEGRRLLAEYQATYSG